MKIDFDTTYQQVIASRHSVRAYVDRPVEEETRSKLERLVEEANSDASLSMQLVWDEPEAFGRSMMAHYGKFSGVRNYLALVGPRGGDTKFWLGYHGERLVLEAQRLGLNSCWVGLTYSKRHSDVVIGPGEKIYGVIALGYGAEQGKAHRSKAPRKVAADYDKAPEWYRRAVDWALLAPTAMNQQKFSFVYLGEVVDVENPRQTVDAVHLSTSAGFFTTMDMGIARLHFELGAGRRIMWQ